MKKIFHLLVLLAAAILLALAAGCEGDIGTIGEDAYGSLDTAAISVSVDWPDEASTTENRDATGIFDEGDAYGVRMSAAPVTLSDNCISRGVDKVRVEVQNSSGDTLKSATFDCSAGQGTLRGVEPQSGCTVVVSGLNSAGNSIYRGSKTNVTLHAGMNNVGRIQVESLYATQYTVIATAGTGGNVTPSSRSVDSGSTASFTVSANSGYTRNTAVGGTCPSGSWSGSTYTTGAISGNCSVSFFFNQTAEPQYSVTASAGTGGSVSPSSRNVESGSTASFTVSENSGYTRNTSVGGTCPSGSWSGSTYTTGFVTGDCSVSFSFSSSSSSITNSIGMTFNYIEPGTFMMGSPSSEPGHFGDETQHQVTLTQGYYMQTTEVTQGQWKAIMGNNPSYFSNCGDNCPVEQVTWNDVQGFIAALNQREGTTRYALPTEAQWEYAARAGSTTAFANGQITHTETGYDPVLDSMGWYAYNSNSRTHPVAQKAPNDWGLYDMHGNVWEWVADWYGRYSSSAVVDPVGPASGTAKVVRGGSYGREARFCRSAHHNNCDNPNQRVRKYGFRIVLLPAH